MTTNRQPSFQPNEIYDIADLARILKVHHRFIRKMIKDGKLPKTKIGRFYKWTGEAILRSLSKN